MCSQVEKVALSLSITYPRREEGREATPRDVDVGVEQWSADLEERERHLRGDSERPSNAASKDRPLELHREHGKSSGR